MVAHTFFHRLPTANRMPPTGQACKNSTWHWPSGSRSVVAAASIASIADATSDEESIAIDDDDAAAAAAAAWRGSATWSHLVVKISPLNNYE